MTLKVAAVLFAATWVIHTLDHARRGLADSPEAVIWAGTIAALMAAVVITLITVGHPTAPAMAAAVFPSIAFGVSASHFLPDWSALISGRTGSRSKLRSSSVRLPGTNV